jgi:SAP domain-containing protein
LKPKTKLSTSMTSTQFDNGYWYATELKDFAKRIGIRFASELRKDELERAIKVFLQTRRIESPARRTLSTSGVRDSVRGLSLDLRVVVYTNDEDTKAFIEREALRLAPGLKRKSGARYRLNRWREDRVANGVAITYRDLVVEYVRLSQTEGPFAQVPHGRYVNFFSDFMAAEQGATRARAIRAWRTLKTLDLPKDYRSWKRFWSSRAKQYAHQPTRKARRSGPS